MAETEYRFDNDEKQKKSSVASFMGFLWNSETKEFCGRDGASWAKISLFYGIFYTCLGAFFVGMLAVFFQIMPVDKPTYYGESSTMAMASRQLNPGLGFRPQIDVEDHQIVFDPTIQMDSSFGLQKYKRNLDVYLAAKYPEVDNLINCETNQTYMDEFNQGKSCEFDYEKIFESTNCTAANSFGYESSTPCVLIKLNRIVSWEPETSNTYISIQCAGENAFDQDSVKKIIYHSENSLNNLVEGKLDKKYFPFMAQKNYQTPFVWAQFEVEPNTLINIECKAYANNIDNTDRLNRRGLTRFSLYVRNKN